MPRVHTPYSQLHQHQEPHPKINLAFSNPTKTRIMSWMYLHCPPHRPGPTDLLCKSKASPDSCGNSRWKRSNTSTYFTPDNKSNAIVELSQALLALHSLVSMDFFLYGLVSPTFSTAFEIYSKFYYVPLPLMHMLSEWGFRANLELHKHYWICTGSSKKELVIRTRIILKNSGLRNWICIHHPLL